MAGGLTARQVANRLRAARFDGVYSRSRGSDPARVYLVKTKKGRLWLLTAKGWEVARPGEDFVTDCGCPIVTWEGEE
jgi:hypothetical protein